MSGNQWPSADFWTAFTTGFAAGMAAAGVGGYLGMRRAFYNAMRKYEPKPKPTTPDQQ